MKFRFATILAMLGLLAAVCAASSAAPYVYPVDPALTTTQKSAAPGYNPDQVEGIILKASAELWDDTDTYYHDGDYPRIIRLCRVISESTPDFMEPYSVGGWLLWSDGDNSDAEDYYKLGVYNNPANCYMYYNLGMFYFNFVKRYPEALTVCKVGTTTWDADNLTWKMLAHSYEKTGQYDKALDIWQEILRRYPDAPAAQVNLDRVRRILDAKKHKTAPSGPAARPDNPEISL